MKNLRQITAQSIKSLGSQATKRVVKHFADKYNFIYFGRVDPREDEFELVRGITTSTTHTDDHYTVGAYNGYEAIFVERRNTVTFPGRKPSSYRWFIVQIDLKSGGIPHIFIDCRHHDAAFYANATMSKNGMQDMSGYFSNASASFSRACRVFAAPSYYSKINHVLTPEIAETISRHFAAFDYEFLDDRILIYASNAVITTNLPEEMLRVGVWLASQVDSIEF